jgi:molecular chaperone GrpE
MKDKVEQLRESIKAKKEAEAKRDAASKEGLSAGMEEVYQKKISELEQSLEQARAECEELKKQAQENYEKFVRNYAEYENLRKRVQREKEEAIRYGSEKLFLELLPVLDSLEKAIEHAEEAPDPKALTEGVRLVLRQFLQVLGKFGLYPLEAAGEPFDPKLHEAMGHHESEAHEPDTVVEEFRRGYKLHDRLLRPALVTVAKPPDKKD